MGWYTRYLGIMKPTEAVIEIQKGTIVMQRVGIFTGTLYDDNDINVHDIHECAIVVSPSASDKEKAIQDAKEYALSKKIISCGNCKSCPESQKVRD